MPLRPRRNPERTFDKLNESSGFDGWDPACGRRAGGEREEGGGRGGGDRFLVRWIRPIPIDAIKFDDGIGYVSPVPLLCLSVCLSVGLCWRHQSHLAVKIVMNPTDLKNYRTAPLESTWKAMRNKVCPILTSWLLRDLRLTPDLRLLRLRRLLWRLLHLLRPLLPVDRCRCRCRLRLRLHRRRLRLPRRPVQPGSRKSILIGWRDCWTRDRWDRLHWLLTCCPQNPVTNF